MKTIFALIALCLALAAPSLADQITFSFTSGAPVSLTANIGGLFAGPAGNIVVSDATTGVQFPLAGTFTANTGVASSFTITPTIVTASYFGSVFNSVLIVDLSNNLIVAGAMDHATFLTGYPDGRGTFLGRFTVSFVSPSVLAMFGLGPTTLPDGAVSMTFANDNPDKGTVIGQLEGGSVTVETSVPESSTLALSIFGFSLIGFSGVQQLRS